MLEVLHYGLSKVPENGVECQSSAAYLCLGAWRFFHDEMALFKRDAMYSFFGTDFLHVLDGILMVVACRTVGLPSMNGWSPDGLPPLGPVQILSLFRLN